MHDVTQMLHLFNRAHILGFLLADVFIDSQYTLTNECLRHCGHVTEIVGNKEHPNNRSLRVQEGRLYCPSTWNRVAFTRQTKLAL